MSIWFANRVSVQEFDAWKSVFYAHADHRQAHGTSDEIVFRDGNNVMVLLEFPDAGAAASFRDDPELRTYMEESGVIGKPDMSGPWERIS